MSSALRESPLDVSLQFRPEREEVCLEFEQARFRGEAACGAVDDVRDALGGTVVEAGVGEPAGCSLRVEGHRRSRHATPVSVPYHSPGRARAPAAGGCAPHTPIPDERAARLWPTHPPSDFLLCGGFAPTPPSGSGSGTQPRGRSASPPASPPRPLRESSGGEPTTGSGGERRSRRDVRPSAGEQRRASPLTPTLSSSGEGAGFEGDRASALSHGDQGVGSASALRSDFRHLRPRLFGARSRDDAVAHLDPGEGHLVPDEADPRTRASEVSMSSSAGSRMRTALHRAPPTFNLDQPRFRRPWRHRASKPLPSQDPAQCARPTISPGSLPRILRSADRGWASALPQERGLP